jgi:hypothetical protein
MFKALARFFDRLEDKVRIKLSHYPIFFGFIGGFAIVEFWRGVWHLTDWIFIKLGFDAYGLFSGLVSVIVSSFLLLITGLYVSLFLSDESIILSGRRGETKKIFERTEEEILEAEKQLPKLMAKIDLLTKEITDIKNELVKK